MGSVYQQFWKNLRWNGSGVTGITLRRVKIMSSMDQLSA
jgi:hypothetical protein